MSHSDRFHGQANQEVGFIGLGRMGLPMARNLSRAGYSLNVYNRTRSKATALASVTSCRVCDTPAEVASRSRLIFTMVSDPQALSETLCGPDGVTSQMQPGTLIVDTSTVGPEAVSDLGRRVEEAGGKLVDAPVSGSVEFASDGTLLLMVGGDPDDVASALPYLNALGRSVVHLGPPGAGARMKLIVNAVLYALIQAVSEALVLAERSGIERSAAYDVLSQSAAGAPLLTYRRHLFEEPHSGDAQFALRLAEKDLRLVLDIAAQVHAPLPQISLIRHIFGRAAAAGFGEQDVTGVAEFLRQVTEDRELFVNEWGRDSNGDAAPP